MSALTLLGLLLLKHGLLAHVVDVGYSRARRPNQTYRAVWLLLHVTLECFVTGCVLYAFDHSFTWVFVGLETVAHLSSCWLERNAPINRLLWAHLYSELWVVLLYCVIVVGTLCYVA